MAILAFVGSIFFVIEKNPFQALASTYDNPADQNDACYIENYNGSRLYSKGDLAYYQSNSKAYLYISNSAGIGRPLPLNNNGNNSNTTWSWQETNNITPGCYLARLANPSGYNNNLNLSESQAPKFKPGNTLPHLVYGAYQLSRDATIEMAKDWGFAMLLDSVNSNQIINSVIPDARNSNGGPTTDNGKILKKSMNDPDHYPLAVQIPRDDEPTNASQDAYLHDKFGKNLMDPNMTTRQAISPEAPESYLRAKAKLQIDPLVELRKYTRIAAIIDDSERGLGDLSANYQNLYFQDPKVVAAMGATNMNDYILEKKAYHNSIWSREIKSAVPDREAYIYYQSGARDDFALTSWRSYLNYDYLRQISDFPDSEFYYKQRPGSWVPDLVNENTNTVTDEIDPHDWYGTKTDKTSIPSDVLTRVLNAQTRQIDGGQPLAFHYIQGGYKNATKDVTSSTRSFIGFLKSAYVSGMIGMDLFYDDYGYAAPFGKGPGGFKAPFDPANPPVWFEQIRAASQVHGLFSYLEPFLRSGDLLSGYNVCNYIKGNCNPANGSTAAAQQPGYEFLATSTTGKSTRNVRVLARRMHDGTGPVNKWLISAWSASDSKDDATLDALTDNVTVNIPTLGTVTVTARAVGSVYYATLNGATPALTQVDNDNTHTNQLLPSATADALYTSGQLNF